MTVETAVKRGSLTELLLYFLRLGLSAPLRWSVMAAIAVAALGGASAQTNDAALRIEAKIPLGDVRGRIDHMAADIDRRRLFVAELGNNTVGIVDLGQGKVRIAAAQNDF